MTGKGSNISKLVSIGSQPLGNNTPALSQAILSQADRLGSQLYNLLTLKNGFYAFESALHIFPAGKLDKIMDLETWNSPDLWRNDYEALSENCLFFAEDIFGGQFCIFKNKICSFEPETGETEEIADSFEDWSRRILEEYDFFTGFSLAHSWQKKYGAIPTNTRLLPKIPFVCGGEFKIDNLYVLDSVKGMKIRADLAKQILNCPEGTQISFRIVE